MKKILIVDDEKILNEVYSLKLAMEGFKTISATSLQEGLYYSRTEKPDLILLETFLARENSIEFLEKLRNEPKTANTSVIAFSNYDSQETRKEAKKLGVKDYLIKTSINPKELVEKVKVYLS